MNHCTLGLPLESHGKVCRKLMSNLSCLTSIDHGDLSYLFFTEGKNSYLPKSCHSEAPSPPLFPHMHIHCSLAVYESSNPGLFPDLICERQHCVISQGDRNLFRPEE